MHRDSLVARGFTQGEGRVEYRIALDEALETLQAKGSTTNLDWSCVDTSSEMELARAAALFRKATEGDPNSHPDDDIIGFLKQLIQDGKTVDYAERIQIGTCAGVPAAVIALKVYPKDGWSSIYYLGVVPAFRRLGFGTEAMLRALYCLKAMGGVIYHDARVRETRQPVPSSRALADPRSALWKNGG